MDSALDFGSSGCGFESHQGRKASVAQRIAHRTSNPGVAGSNPAGGAFLFFLSSIANIIFTSFQQSLNVDAKHHFGDF